MAMIGKHIWTLAGVLLASVGTVQAQPFQGVYIGGGAGYNFPQDIHLQTATPSSPRAKLGVDGGFVGVGSIGYGFGNGFRLELEGNFRNTEISRFVFNGVGAPGSGSLRTYGVMANALFDMDIGMPWLYPYLGGGAGYAWTTAHNVVLGNPAGPGGGAVTTGTQGRPAVQAIGGLSFPIPGAPGLSITSEYRFFGVLGQESFSTTAFPGPTSTQLKTQNQFNHSLLVGVRYAFGIVPPAAVATQSNPAPVPAVAAARSYLVFFDWDKATLTDRARAIVKEAAQASTRVQITRIEVNGYTDSSGTPQYNQALSIRRAEAVASQLINDGVPKTAIAIQGFGETKPLVPTGANVREPQNRRVEIVIR